MIDDDATDDDPHDKTALYLLTFKEKTCTSAATWSI